MSAVRAQSELSRLYRIRKTVVEMLRDRGYLLQDVELERSIEEFASALNMLKQGEFGLADKGAPDRDSLVILAPMVDDPTDQIFVFFSKGDSSNNKVGVTAIKTFVDRMKENSVRRAIVIVEEGFTPFAKSAMAEALHHGFRFEQFFDHELVINISKHEFVPIHQVLTREEKRQLLTRYKVNEMQIPRIQVNDAMARYLGLSKGQVVRIVRPSETAGRYVTYRICV